MAINTETPQRYIVTIALLHNPLAAIKLIRKNAKTPIRQPASFHANNPIAITPQAHGIPTKNFFTGSKSDCKKKTLIASNASKKFTLIYFIASDQKGPVVIVNSFG